ncbi:hypothetical protein HS088_TW09G01405 [Tripterygium wilfordii]|uniref:Uncharacterized protein n=1 Tax=Tripterygium wilfordii TaxID=458696 RepID=A0A7J7DAQ6_TRIWF|nr:hypothetical protein HS088_TW09G01405 [Tripterygium wilfordii]
MINDLTREITEETLSCFALSKNDSYLMSASRGKLSLYNLLTFKTMTTIMPPPPVATCVAFYPQDNNAVAIGMDDSTIIIYSFHLAKVISKLESHSQPVTGLAFSNILKVLVSSGADAQIVLWNVDGWGKQKSRSLKFPPIKKITGTFSDTFIQFHQDQTHFLIVHDTHLAIYEAKNLQRVKQWVPGNSTSISHATFSSDSQIVYACFMDGTISIFDASNLELHCQIASTENLHPSSSSSNVYPCVTAAHPQKPTQFAVGLTDGGVIVLEPPKPGGKWGYAAAIVAR